VGKKVLPSRPLPLAFLRYTQSETLKKEDVLRDGPGAGDKNLLKTRGEKREKLRFRGQRSTGDNCQFEEKDKTPGTLNSGERGGLRDWEKTELGETVPEKKNEFHRICTVEAETT